MARRKRYSLDIRQCIWNVREAEGPQMPNGAAFAAQFRDIINADRELFFAVTLNQKNSIIDRYMVSMGTLTSSLVHPREAFKSAIMDSAASVAFVHNHPSGNPEPSQQDRELCTRLCDCCKLLGIRLLDFIIVARDGYASFTERGWL
jgi:DNA repair protein RadC